MVSTTATPRSQRNSAHSPLSLKTECDKVLMRTSDTAVQNISQIRRYKHVCLLETAEQEQNRAGERVGAQLSQATAVLAICYPCTAC